MPKYKTPSLTVDAIIQTPQQEYILIQRKNPPYQNQWALPGGFIEYGETTEEATIREAKEETGLNITLTKLIGVYSKPNRDPRGHTISIAYLARTNNMDLLKADSDAQKAKTFTIEEIKNMELAFDHNQIIKDAKL